MAYALVSGGTVSTGASPITPAFGQATGVGNLLIACVANSSTTTTTASAGWTQAAFASLNGAAEIWYKANCAAGETAPTFTRSLATLSAVLAEFSGGATTSPLDRNVGGTDSASTGSITVNAAGADAAAAELIITAMHQTLTKAGTTTSANTYNNGATATSLGQNDATSTAEHYDFNYGITTSNSAADQDAHTESSMNIFGGTLVLASFKLAAVVANPFHGDENRSSRRTLRGPDVVRSY